MRNNDFILFAYQFDGHGYGHVLEGDAIHQTVKAKNLAWVHLDATHPKTAGWLSDHVDYLDPVVINALLADETRPRISFLGDGAMIILRGMNLQEGAEPEDMVSLRLWIDKSRIISLRRRPLKAVQDIRTSLEQGTGPKNAGDFLALLCQRLFERMQPTLMALSDAIDTIEEDMLDSQKPSIRHQVNEIRRESLIYKRYISPQRDVMMALRNIDNSPWIKDVHIRHFQENQDRLTRYLEDLDSIRERAQIIKEEYTNMIADRMNKNTYALSLIAGIFLPLGFLTGILGINVGGIPGVDNPFAFWIVVVLCTLTGFAFMGLFKLLKWL